MDESKLAILGLGSRSTTFYIHELNRLFNQRHGGYSTFPFKLLNTNFNKINPLLPNTSSALDKVMQTYLSALEKWDSQNILIPNITLHETIDRLKVSTPIIHPIQLIIQELQNQKINQIVILGSLYSMQSNYISSKLTTIGIKVTLPKDDEMKFLDSFRKNVYDSLETTSDIKKYHDIILKYQELSTVVIACTELSIHCPKNTSNVLDLATLQISKAVRLIVKS